MTTGTLARVTGGPYLTKLGQVGRVVVTHDPQYVRLALRDGDSFVYLDLRADEVREVAA